MFRIDYNNNQPASRRPLGVPKTFPITMLKRIEDDEAQPFVIPKGWKSGTVHISVHQPSVAQTYRLGGIFFVCPPGGTNFWGVTQFGIFPMHDPSTNNDLEVHSNGFAGLSGTTGTDGKASLALDGRNDSIWIENRMGKHIWFKVTFL